MTPATEALVERLAHAEQVQRWANNDPMVSLLVEAQVEIRRLSAEQNAENANRSPTDFFAENAKNPPPAGEE